MKLSTLRKAALTSASVFVMAISAGTAHAQTQVDFNLDVETLTITATPTAGDLGTWVIVYASAATSPADDFIVRTSVAGASALAPASTLNNGNIWVQNDAANVSPANVAVAVTPNTGTAYNLTMDISGCTDFGSPALTIDNTNGAAPLRFAATAGTINGGATFQADFCDAPITVPAVTDVNGALDLDIGLDVVVSDTPAVGPHQASFDVTFAF